MKKYQQLKEIIQEANPEIMELKFGCEVELQNYKNPLRIILWEEGIDYGVVSLNARDGENQSFQKKHIIKILGRPIRLADVLLAIKNRKMQNVELDIYITKNGYSQTEEIRFKYHCDLNDYRLAIWNLKDDNLDHQSDTTKKFLIELLVK